MITSRLAFNCRSFPNTKENWKKCLSSIQKEELVRLSEFVHQNSVISSLVGRLMLRHWAHAAYSMPWKHVELSRTKRGRPFVRRDESCRIVNNRFVGNNTERGFQDNAGIDKCGELLSDKLESLDVGNQVDENLLTQVEKSNEESSFNQIKKSRDANLAKEIEESNGVDSLLLQCEGSLDVNVSHQGDWVVLGAARDGFVGVDVMSTKYSGGRSVAEFFRLMTRQFTESEWKNIKAPPDEAGQLRNFYRHWCLKEAFVKALGVGITFNLQRISFNINSEGTTVHVDGVQDLRWKFEESFLDDQNCACIALFSVKDCAEMQEESQRMELLFKGLGNNTQRDSQDSLELFRVVPLEFLLNGCEEMSEITDEMVESFMNKPNVPWLVEERNTSQPSHWNETLLKAWD